MDTFNTTIKNCPTEKLLIKIDIDIETHNFIIW